MHEIEKRLRKAYDFEPNIINQVVEAAADQDITYKEFVTKYKVSQPKSYKPKGLPAVQLLDLQPRAEPIVREVAVLHLPMANGLTRNKVFRSVVWHLANPHQRLIVFANPGVVGKDHYGKPQARHLLKVARGDLKPVVASSLEYLKEQQITKTAQFGYSFGADRALAMTALAPQYDITVDKLAIIEPASVVSKRFLRLAHDFNAGGKGLKQTLRQTDSLLLRESRQRRNEHIIPGMTALLRPTNLAIARALSKGGFEHRLKEALEAQPTMKVYIAWGSESELSPDELMQELTRKYAQQHPGRIAHARLRGNHSMADDVALHAAIMLQATHTLNQLS
jgi:pimeloyl-ACP methyl ester carboxylesterase